MATVPLLLYSGRITTTEGVYNGSWMNDDKNGVGTMKYSNMDEY